MSVTVNKKLRNHCPECYYYKYSQNANISRISYLEIFFSPTVVALYDRFI